MINKLRIYLKDLSLIGQIVEISNSTRYEDDLWVSPLRSLPTIIGTFAGEIPQQLVRDFYESVRTHFDVPFDMRLDNTTFAGRCRFLSIENYIGAFRLYFTPARKNQIEMMRVS